MFAFFLFCSIVFISSASIIDRFEEWSNHFNIKFLDDNHYLELFKKWRENDVFINNINSQNLTYILDHNQFSGMNTDDFRKYLNLSKISDTDYAFSRIFLTEPVTNLPSYVNWLEQGSVTPVKDQGQCGSCWSFSSTGALEGAYFNKVGELVSFSEQQLVDCDTLKNGGKDHGCNGGLMDNAFSWIHNNGGLCSESDYPYISGVSKTSGTCNKDCSIVKNSKVNSFVDIPPSSDDFMLSALVKQPVSIAIEADERAFQLYKSGVFTGTCGTKLDHGVLAIGYGTQDSNDYYIVKNSWGVSWGMNGYILLGRGINPTTHLPYNNGDGQCGILLQASYPVV
jgi:C1A family cysteine protease